ncbi:MAG: hypothetical protein Q4G09_00760 [Clostridia bacterium]|nr:hypothetical protein [Clostridia bacterium]
MKKILKKILIVFIATLLLTTVNSFALFDDDEKDEDELDFKAIIKEEGRISI